MKPNPKQSPIARIVRENRAMWKALVRDINLEPEDLVPSFVVPAAGQAFRPL